MGPSPYPWDPMLSPGGQRHTQRRPKGGRELRIHPGTETFSVGLEERKNPVLLLHCHPQSSKLEAALFV